MAQSASSAAPDARGQFQRIGTHARAAVQALDEIVWATNPRNDNLPRFAEYVSRFADEFFDSSPIRCWQEVPSEMPDLPLRADLRHNVFLAIREAFHNVLKHSNATQLWLRLTYEDSNVRLEIEDNGQGFSSEEAQGSGNGLGNMKRRLSECGGRAEIKSTPGQGTIIRFEFPARSVTEPASPG
jgi:signal transduction histidine kinase